MLIGTFDRETHKGKRWQVGLSDSTHSGAFSFRSSSRTRRVNVNKWIKARTFWTACSPRVVVGAWVAFQTEKQFPTAGAQGWKKKKTQKNPAMVCRQVLVWWAGQTDERDVHTRMSVHRRGRGTKIECISLYHRATSGYIWVPRASLKSSRWITQISLLPGTISILLSAFSLQPSPRKSWKLTKWPHGDWMKLCIFLSALLP